jgi:hypothetical protein
VQSAEQGLISRIRRIGAKHVKDVSFSMSISLCYRIC